MGGRSRDDWIRTSDLVVPNDARYRATLHPVKAESKNNYLLISEKIYTESCLF